MSTLVTIAGITLRNAFRSRLAWTSLSLLFAAIILLPLTLRSDNTVQGHVKIITHYTLTAISLLLGITSIWVGCTAITTEIKKRTLFALTSKPVHRWQIWLGKWFGILALNAILLMISGTLVYFLSISSAKNAANTPAQESILNEQVFTAREPIYPIRTQSEFKPVGAPQNQSITWRMQLPNPYRSDQPLSIDYVFTGSAIGMYQVAQHWAVLSENKELLFETTITSAPHTPQSIRIPADLIEPGQTILLKFTNRASRPLTIVFTDQEAVRLMAGQSSFLFNYMKALLILFCQLALLGALGLAAGTLFSAPVAALTSFYCVLLIKSIPYIQRTVQNDEWAGDPTAWDSYVQGLFSGLATVLRPLENPAVYNWLSSGILIPNDLVWQNILYKLIIYSGCCALISIFVFNRKELGLAS